MPAAIEAQAGSAGIGWHLGGVSYIARTDTLYDNGVPDTDKKFALVLNGTRVSISFQDGLWRTNPEIFAKIIWPGANSYTGNAQYQAHDYSPWTVWTGDGTKYEFGDAGTFPNAFSSVSPTGTSSVPIKTGRPVAARRLWSIISMMRSGAKHGPASPG